MADSHLTPTCGIYQIRCLANGKVYVGSSVNVEHRWKVHQSTLNRGKHHSPMLQHAWRKYGSTSFVFEVIMMVPSAELVRTEQQFMDQLRACDRSRGFNVAPTAGSPLGRKTSLETRLKQSLASKGKPKTPEHRRNAGLARKGKTITEEWRRKLSESHKGIIPTPEILEKRRVSMTGKNMKITSEKLAVAREMLGRGALLREVAEIIGVSISTVSNIRRNRQLGYDKLTS